MVSTAKAAIARSLTKIESVFVPGKLTDKRDEIVRLREAGDTMFFDGHVKWSVTLPDYDKRLNGASESLDGGFADMAACLNLLARDHDNDTHVICAVETLQAGEEE